MWLNSPDGALLDLLGISAMTLAKSLARLKRAGSIETGYRRVTLTDPVPMRRWLAEREAE